MSFRAECPRSKNLGRLPLSELDADWVRHLESCAECHLDVARYRAMAAALQASTPRWSAAEEQRERHRLLSSLESRGTSRPRRWWLRPAVIGAALLIGSTAAALGGRSLWLQVLRPNRQSVSSSAPSPGLNRKGRAPAHPGGPSGEPSAVPRPGAPVGDGPPPASLEPGLGPPAPSTELEPGPAPASPGELERKGSPPGGALGSGDSHGVGVPTSEGPRVGKTNGAPDARPERRIAGLAPSPAEVQFAKGWDAIRSGDRAAAARSFAAAAASDPGSAIAEDALYWEAATLGRLGRAAEARRLLEEFLARYTASPRTSEIRVMLAWNLMASGENVEAERLFRASLDDSSGFVRKSARAGVDALRARGTSSNP